MKGDTSLRLGDALSDVPSQRASVCNSYACQASALKGLGLGAGIYYVGARSEPAQCPPFGRVRAHRCLAVVSKRGLETAIGCGESV